MLTRVPLPSAEINKILVEEFEILEGELIAEYYRKGMNASERFVKELEVKVIDNSAKLIGPAYAQQLETGRRAGKQPPSSVIEQWIKDKGIASRIEEKISISSLAFLIARKIGREGWKRERYGGVELVSSVITPQRIQRIIDRCGDVVVEHLSTQVIRELTQK